MEDKERLLVELQKKVTSLERRLQGNLSQDEHLQELLQEVKNKSWVYFMTVAHGWQLTMLTEVLLCFMGPQMSL